MDSAGSRSVLSEEFVPVCCESSDTRYSEREVCLVAFVCCCFACDCVLELVVCRVRFARVSCPRLRFGIQYSTGILVFLPWALYIYDARSHFPFRDPSPRLVCGKKSLKSQQGSRDTHGTHGQVRNKVARVQDW